MWLMLIQRGVVVEAERTSPLLFPRYRKVLIRLGSEPEPPDKKR